MPLSQNLLNSPNAVTLFRLLLIIPFVVILAQGNLAFAVVLFAFISLLDAVDGFVARYTHQQSYFGELFDGISDLIIILVAFISSAKFGYIPLAWHDWLMIAAVVLFVAKALHFYLCKTAVHTIAGKITATLAYLAIIFSLIPNAPLPVFIVLFLVSSCITSLYFLVKIVQFKKSS